LEEKDMSGLNMNVENYEEDEYLHIDGVVTIPKSSGLTAKELESEFIKFIEEKKCFFGGGTCKVDSDGNELEY
jgi:hypothetical protein